MSGITRNKKTKPNGTVNQRTYAPPHRVVPHSISLFTRLCSRNEFTIDEDKLLFKCALNNTCSLRCRCSRTYRYIGRYNPDKEGRLGNNLYKTLVENVCVFPTLAPQF